MNAWETHDPLFGRIPDDPAEPWEVRACSCLAKPAAEDDGRSWFASHIEALGAPDYMVGYWQFWSVLVEKTANGIDRDQVARELHDYNVVMAEASKVYDELAGLSKPNTAAHHVIDAARTKADEWHAELILADLLPLVEGEGARQAVIDYAETLHPGAWEEHQRATERRVAMQP